MGRELSRIANAPEAHDLAPAQYRAITAMVGGATITAAAEAAGVSRPTVYNWLDGSPAFVAELNKLRAEQRDAIRDELRGLAPIAVVTLRRLLECSSPSVRLRAALAVLDRVGAEAIGPTDAGKIAVSQKWDDLLSLRL